MLAAFVTTILFSISAVSANRSARLMGGAEANFWRIALAAALLAAWAHLAGQGLGGGAFHLFLLSGVVGFGLGDVALFQALPRLGSRLTVLIIHCLAAPLASLTEWLWLGTRLSLAEILCGLTILAGVGFALAPSEHLHIPRRKFMPGILFALLATFGQGFGAVLSRKANLVAALGNQGVDGITAAYQRIIGGVIVGGVALLIAKRREIASLVSNPAAVEGEPSLIARHRAVAPWVVLNAVTGPAMGVSCFQWALKTTPTGIVLPIVAITPLMVIPFARYLENERPGMRSLVGGAIAVAGAAALAWVSNR